MRNRIHKNKLATGSPSLRNFNKKEAEICKCERHLYCRAPNNKNGAAEVFLLGPQGFHVHAELEQPPEISRILVNRSTPMQDAKHASAPCEIVRGQMIIYDSKPTHREQTHPLEEKRQYNHVPRAAKT